MSDTQRRVPWQSGTSASVGPLPQRLGPSDRATRCRVKRAQVVEMVSGLKRQRSLLKPKDRKAIAQVDEQIAFQELRAKWLVDFEAMPESELRAIYAALQQGLGPERIAAMREGLTAGLSPVEVEELARFALLSYALGER